MRVFVLALLLGGVPARAEVLEPARAGAALAQYGLAVLLVYGAVFFFGGLVVRATRR